MKIKFLSGEKCDAGAGISFPTDYPYAVYATPYGPERNAQFVQAFRSAEDAERFTTLLQKQQPLHAEWATCSGDELIASSSGVELVAEVHISMPSKLERSDKFVGELFAAGGNPFVPLPEITEENQNDLKTCEVIPVVSEDSPKPVITSTPLASKHCPNCGESLIEYLDSFAPH